jgi:glycosyltransferase involved in cell wall biosynthesis
MEPTMTVECLDPRFSTTRRLTRDSDHSAVQPIAPQVSGGIQCGGLRKTGLFKVDGSRPLITVITVVYNGADVLENTILSVLGQSYDNIEYIVVDGGSTDNTLQVIKKYEHALDYWLTEPDRGIYDAMNKAIAAARGGWLNFMNAGDAFRDQDTVLGLVEKHIQRSTEHRFIYSDVLLVRHSGGESTVTRHRCDHTRLIVNHQACIYRKELHLQCGLYLVAKGVTISDYLFFSLVPKADFLRVDDPIARYDVTGISQSRKAVEQKFIVDYLVNGMPRYKFTLYFLLYYYYRNLKGFVSRWRSAGRSEA